MNDTRNRPGLMHHAARLLLDGDRPWGSIDIRPDRFGVTRYRLVVYPPGISESERRRVRVARGWPLWGALVWIVSEIFLVQVMGPWTALAMSTGVLLGLGVIAVAMAGEPRTQVRTAGATVMVGHEDRAAISGRDRLASMAATLCEADERLARGEISAATHEAVWHRIYDEMAPVSPAVHTPGGA